MALRRIFSLLFLVIAISILSFNCDYKNESYGNFDEIIVFSDTTLYEYVKPQFEQVFDRFIYTPNAERSFLIEFQSLDRLDLFQMRRNLVFLALLNGEDRVSKYIRNALSPELHQAVRDGRIFQIFQKNFFATDQMAIILCAVSAEVMKENLKNYSDKIFEEFDNYHFQRLEKIMFLRAEQTLLEEYFADNLGWTIRVQHDYFVAKETPDGNFVWLRRLKPDRNIFVYRFKASALPSGQEWMYQLRDSLSFIYFESDSVERDDTYIKNITFQGKPAFHMIGVWQNHNLYIGGPFRSIFLFDEITKYVYMIDYLVTAPGERKKPFLDQLEVMARSFRLVH